jgi:type II secretion system protein N
VLVFVAACGSSGSASDPPEFPDDHKLHDLSTDDAQASRLRYGGKQVSLADVPILADRIGLPITGTGDVSIDLTIPKVGNTPDYTKATGTISITCTKCQIGDDKARLKMPARNASASAFGAEGLAFGHVAIDHLEMNLTAANGRIELTHWKFASPDVDLDLSLTLQLSKSLQDSGVESCVRFKPTDTLEKRDPKTHTMLSLTGANRGSDAYFSIAVEGSIKNARRLARECSTKE